MKFEVEDFRADKSTGKETSRADYTVNVYLRDREDDGPIESIKMAHGLVKGPGPDVVPEPRDWTGSVIDVGRFDRSDDRDRS